MVLKSKDSGEDVTWLNFSEKEEGPLEHELPKVTILIPTLNSGPLIASTLDSLISQDYPSFEIIVIDAGSIDRTPQIVKGLQDPRIKFYSVSDYSRYEMLNKGITHATGLYINCLFPGDYYIHHSTLKKMMVYAYAHHNPSLVYCGTLLRDGKSNVKVLYRKLTLKLLKLGKQPTSLQSCWIKIDVFKKIGKFDTTFNLRGGLDFLCRFMLDKTLSVASTQHVYTDYDLRTVTRKMVVSHFVETWKIVYKYFGSWAVLKWVFRQKDLFRYLDLWKNSIQNAFHSKS